MTADRVPLPPTGRTATLVLASGASERFGGFPKACLDIGGEPAVRRIARLARDAGASPVVVVVGPHAPEVRRALGSEPVAIVENDGWAAGRTGSVQAGLERVPEGDDILLWPVDHPLVGPETLADLADARIRDRLAIWFIPVFRGESGHPVLIGHEARSAVEALAPATPLRAVLPHLGPQVRRVPVHDPGVVANLDTPEAFRLAVDRWRGGWTVG